MLAPLSCMAAFLLLSIGVASDSSSYRLPLQVIPDSYELRIAPDLDTFTFDGTVIINVTAQQAVHNITLHVDGLTIASVTVLNQDSITTSEDRERDFLIIHLTERLEIGATYTIVIDYNGEILDGLSGFFRRSYVAATGETRSLAATQFQPTYARKAFPCFDEPALKATFDVRIAPPNGTHAISNMPLISISKDNPEIGNRTWYIFDRSVRMPTYLVAFVVSDYCYISDGGIQRIYGPCDDVATGRYALSVSQPVLDLMANWTGHPYQLPKLDQAAIPDVGGAMENWGLVIYGSEFLLLPEETYEEKYWSMVIIAHELSHQWFGNQVTLSWWSHTWINEGFAAFFQYFASDKIEPTWELMDEFVYEVQYWMMYMDSFEDFTLPMTRAAETPVEIKSSFDSFAYDKGGCIIKQMYHILGETTFFSGLNLYLTNNAYGAVTSDNLADGWQEAVDERGGLPEGITVKSILDSWTLQAGYPVLTVERDYEAGTATITQRHFLKDGVPNEDRRWYVPISYTTESVKNFEKTEANVWIIPSEDNVTISGLAADDWLVVNIQRAYYYRVNYDAENWNRLLNSTENDDMPSLNAVQIYDDLFELESIGLLPPGVNIPWDECRLSKLPSSIRSKMLFRQMQPKDRAAALVAACGAAGPQSCELALRYVSNNLSKLVKTLGGPEEVFWLLKRMSSLLSTKTQVLALQNVISTAQEAWPQLISSAAKSRLVDEAEEAITYNKLGSGAPTFGRQRR